MEAAWIPSKEEIEKTRLYQWMRKLGYDTYDDFYRASVKDVGWFWEEVVKDLQLNWTTPYRQVLDLTNGIAWPRWFVGGELNVSACCLDRFAEDPSTCDREAILFEGEDGTTTTYTYHDLWLAVNHCASGLSKIGVNPGDRVAVYLPMIPENVIAILAIARIGAIVIPCFSGFGADAVATRMEDGQVKVLITADGFHRRGKAVLLKEEADRAADQVSSVEKVVVIQRLGEDCPWNDLRDVRWKELVAEARMCPAYKTDTNDPFMIIYTSGTTGKPKGTVHVHSGFPIKAAFDAGYVMDVRARDRLFWVTDMGWMMGPWMVFGSLMVGATMLMYDGSPDYPRADRLWQLVDKHRVTHLGVSPTLVRALMKHGDAYLEDVDLSSLRVFGSTGEPWNPKPWHWLFEKVGKKRVPIFNYSGGTEISGGILGNTLLKPIASCGFNGPLPGMDADVLDEKGQPVCGEVGELVLRQPWVGMTSGFWKDDQRYVDAYWQRFEDVWVHGDWVRIDEDGMWYITGRSDDTLKIAGKRLGPAEMESVLVMHPAVAEAATIGIPDAVKGEAAVCFVVCKLGIEGNAALEEELLSFVTERMGKALKPQRVFIVEDLPKTRNGKILRRVIKSAFLGQEMGDLSSLESPTMVNAIIQVSRNGTIPTT